MKNIHLIPAGLFILIAATITAYINWGSQQVSVSFLFISLCFVGIWPISYWFCENHLSEDKELQKNLYGGSLMGTFFSPIIVPLVSIIFILVGTFFLFMYIVDSVRKFCGATPFIKVKES
jgi:hypothetical protein